MKATPAQLKASYRWKKKHPDKQRTYQYASYARKFIRDLASEQQLHELQALIEKRLNQLNK